MLLQARILCSVYFVKILFADICAAKILSQGPVSNTDINRNEKTLKPFINLLISPVASHATGS